MMDVFAFFTSDAWVDYAIVIGFMVFALILIGFFMESGPKKWLAFLGVLLGGGLALTWTGRRRRYTEEKLKKHNDHIKGVLDRVEERDKQVERNNAEIQRLGAERERLRQAADTDQVEIDAIEKRINERLLINQKFRQQIQDQETGIADYLEKREQQQPLPSADSILEKYGLLGKRPTTDLVSDPEPPPKAGDTIEVRGFIMKGDV